MLGKLRKSSAVRGALLLLSYFLLVTVAALGSVLPVAVTVLSFAVVGLAAVVGELGLPRWSPPAIELLDRVGLGRTFRQLVRDLSVALLVVTAVRPAAAPLGALLILLAGVWVLAVSTDAVGALRAHFSPVTARIRNINLGRADAQSGPPAVVRWLAGDRMPLLNSLLVPAAVVAVLVESAAPVVALAAVTFVLAAAVGVTVVADWLRARRQRRGPNISGVQRWLKEYQPEVALYFAGPGKDVYQANMWLAPIEALGKRAVVLLRQDDAFSMLADTRLPVISVMPGVDFMNLDLSHVRVALYAANVGANIHMLREPGTKHVFVGHGDSDKQASVNPYSKVYDEVWVAGLAGRERYARAGVGVLDQDIVEIGRPQLAGVQTFGAGATGRPFTVLYAPTWEGWQENDPYHTSLVLMGERIVRGLLAATPPVRVVYKPHPLTGSRSKAARAVHERVVRLIRAAGGEIDATSLDGPAHRVVTGRTPALFDCFNQTDLLISDVSSVVSDFVQSQRPYAVANPSGLSEDEFRTKFPTARAAYLLSADCGELEKVLAVTRTGEDPMAQARQELKTYLLGPDEPNPMERFRMEIDRLCG